MGKAILFVDDEKGILNSIRREFYDSDYDLFFADSGSKALKILEENHIHMLVTDMKMPLMDGYELLKRVKISYPNLIKIILSGYTDEKLVFKSMCNNLAQIYLTKPWDKDDLKKIIERLFDTDNTLNHNDTLKAIKNLCALPTINNIYMKINESLSKDEYDINEIVGLIESDPTLSSNILRVVNSAFYGIKTSSIKTAVLNLGINNLKTLILASEVFCFKEHTCNKEFIWKHSSLTNNIVIAIYKYILHEKIPEAFATAGLLHDIGKIVFLKLHEEEYESICTIVKKGKEVSYSKVEKDMFGVNHEEVGAYLLQWWGMPYAVVETALYHCNPLLSSEVNRKIVSVVHIANHYSCKMLNCDFIPEIYNEIFEIIDVNKNDIEKLIDKLDKGEK